MLWKFWEEKVIRLIISLFLISSQLLVGDESGKYFDFKEVARIGIPTVVSIKTEALASPKSSEVAFWEIADESGTPPPLGQGSGFFISADGYILTNNHVIRSANRMIVILTDGRQFQAQLVGADPNTDLAVLKITGDNHPFLSFGDSNKLEIGEWVAAIGAPMGLQGSVSVGIISAKGRQKLELAEFEDFLQTDAAINKGNSGGPLLNLQGEVVGINTAIASSTGGYMGIGFAIPCNIAKNVVHQLIQSGTVLRGFLDITLQEVTPEIAQALHLRESMGVVITDVIHGSPAEKAGLRAGDVILKYDEQTVENILAMRNAVSLAPPGSIMKLTVSREGQVVDINVPISQSPGLDSSTHLKHLGLKLSNISPDQAKQFGYPESYGILVMEVAPGSLADQAQLKPGQVILSLNRQQIDNVEEFNNILKTQPVDARLLLLVRQGDTKLFISLKLVKGD